VNFIRRALLLLLGVLALFGVNYIYNPSIDDTEEYWDRQEKLHKAELKTRKLVENIESKKESGKPEKSFLDKVKDELEKE
jgi:predicted adenine nucleotide alpha hydrolase (AANH) superfamily ATPase